MVLSSTVSSFHLISKGPVSFSFSFSNSFRCFLGPTRALFVFFLKGLPDPEEEKKAEPAQEAEQEAAPEAPQPAEAAPEVQAEPAPEEEPEPVPAEQPKPQMPRGRFSDIPMDQVSKDDTSV